MTQTNTASDAFGSLVRIAPNDRPHIVVVLEDALAALAAPTPEASNYNLQAMFDIVSLMMDVEPGRRIPRRAAIYHDPVDEELARMSPIERSMYGEGIESRRNPKALMLMRNPDVYGRSPLGFAAVVTTLSGPSSRTIEENFRSRSQHALWTNSFLAGRNDHVFVPPRAKAYNTTTGKEVILTCN